MNIPDEAAKGAPGAPPTIADLETRVKKALGIRINDLSDLTKPELAKAAADHLCSSESRYLEPKPPLDNLSILVSNLLKNGEIGKSSPHDDSAQQAIWWGNLKEATFYHIRLFALSLMMELSNRCPVPTNPPPSFTEWKAHFDRETNTTVQLFHMNQLRESENLVVEAVDILLHTSPDSRREVLEALVSGARNAFRNLKDTKPLEEWDVIFHTEEFSQKIIENLVLRAPESLSGPAADTKRKVRGALGEDEGKAA